MPKVKLYAKIMMIAGTSFLLETTQYVLAIGRSDITDVLTNTVGGLLGLIVYLMVARLIGNRIKANRLFSILAGIVSVTLHLTLYPNFVSSKFVIACAALAELYPLSAKEFAKPVLQMAEKFHSFNTFDLKQIGFGRRRQVSDLPKCLQDLCLFFYSEISVYWSLAVTAESNAERQLIARAAIKKASTLAYLPCHADIDLKLLDLIHIAYTDGIQKSDLYRYDSQTFNIIISGETGELLCKYDES